jgi:hypothetical protein
MRGPAGWCLSDQGTENHIVDGALLFNFDSKPVSGLSFLSCESWRLYAASMITIGFEYKKGLLINIVVPELQNVMFDPSRPPFTCADNRRSPSH